MPSNIPATPAPPKVEGSNRSASPDRKSSPPIVQTHLHRASDILKDNALAHTLTTFINEGYATSSLYPSTRWDHQPVRFHTPTDIHDMLGTDGMIAAIYHISREGGQTEPVAVASISRWHGDMDGVGAQDEDGWEIKAVTTKSGWGKMGLVGRCIETITQDLIAQEQSHGEEKVKLWLHAVEEVNGDYWRRRGWNDVRGFNRPEGYWGSKFGFRLSVLLKEVDVH
ncbi:uncharacterized protein CC84DRAFT_1167530 [Paraphaeosphaeria sporulosa]|uniref:N-acetyltransferase domain-containing protein n=1 Tax=Paraphaeosphaeria sporulosa TaxID=1460663 RepID=A0A177C4X8_9PLEO|nr:uncharacterized protein CC84DRAFT_1167530 [Paraphaeosphaeria sporulosa]OAG02486.1 hypothetical protein CC84DRAFT_1167530 [Paraphaeosphaeria sporulosa]